MNRQGRTNAHKNEENDLAFEFAQLHFRAVHVLTFDLGDSHAHPKETHFEELILGSRA
jgi:hypothetical protein